MKLSTTYVFIKFVSKFLYALISIDYNRLAFQGVVASGLAFAIQIWVVERGGPMLVAAYLPLQTLVAAVMASVFLSEAFSLGR